MKSDLDCNFTSGDQDFLYTGVYGELKVKETEEGETVVTTVVSMVTGSFVSGGIAELDSETVTLTYNSFDNGSVCFEQYSLEICFTIKTALLPPEPKYILKNEHESRGPVNEFL